MKDKMNRREFLEKVSLLGIGAIGAGALLNACGGKKEEAAPQSSGQAAKADPCADLTGLTADEKQLRVTFQYVAESPYPDKLCDNCGFWVAPEGGAACGGCKVIKGPIHPKGHCTSWVAMPPS